MLTSSQKAETVVVSRPRQGDAVGMALRDAYAREFGLPDEFAVLLRKLNGETGGCASTVRN